MLMRVCMLFMLVCLIVLPAAAENAPEETLLFEGAATSSAINANIQFVFTAHVGGAWDAAQMNEGCAFRVTYAGPENAIFLALSSHSGATQWARIDAAEVAEDGDRRIATFAWPDIVKAWGTNFARLDQLTVFSATAEEVTVNRIAYVPGEGDPADASDGRWDRADTGVAFIGDSICQNAMLLFGDWNTLLSRKDCSNYGVGGQTTTHCLARIDELCGRGYDQVVFICGINELGRSDYKTGIAANIAAMIQALRESDPNIQAAIVSVLPTTEAFYYGMQDRIVSVNASLAALAEELENVAFVDCYSDFLDPERGYAKPELLSDGLHPNADGYAVIVEHLAPVLVPEKE